jgi:hypothetical protein
MSRFRIQSNMVYWVSQSRETQPFNGLRKVVARIRKRESAVRTSNSDEGKKEGRKPACEDWKTCEAVAEL